MKVNLKYNFVSKFKDFSHLCFKQQKWILLKKPQNLISFKESLKFTKKLLNNLKLKKSDK